MDYLERGPSVWRLRFLARPPNAWAAAIVVTLFVAFLVTHVTIKLHCWRRAQGRPIDGADLQALRRDLESL